MPFTKANAAEHGAKSKRGKGAKNSQWDELGDAIVGRHTDRFHAILEGAEDVAFVAGYMEILKYFRPKLASVHNTGSMKNININVVGDADTINKI